MSRLEAKDPKSWLPWIEKDSRAEEAPHGGALEINKFSQRINKEEEMKKELFWIFGILQSISLAAIVFLLFRALELINGERVIGLDTQITLSVAFPLFLLVVEYLIYSRK
jgi:hypothetical protein